MRSFVAYIEQDPETKLYVGTIPGIPGAHTQTADLNELQTNFEEVCSLCLLECDETTEEVFNDGSGISRQSGSARDL